MHLLLAAACLLCFCLFPCLGMTGQRMFLDTDKPHYVNKVHGFSFTLPPGQWDAVESDDGKEITIHDGADGDTDVTKIRVVARDGYANIPLQTLLNEETKGYRNILKEEVSPNNDWFALTAEDAHDNYVFIKYILKEGKANVLVVTASRTQKASFDSAVSRLVKSFSPGFGR